jgi:sulfur relay (sulfurtransferase) DsrF/TusC family protein
LAEKKVIVSFNHAPYGTIFYTEGLRAAVGVTAGLDEHSVNSVFLGDGVYFTLKDVNRDDSSKYLTTLSDMGSKLYAEEESLQERNISTDQVADDVEVVPRSRVLELFREADCNIDF